MSAFLFLCKLAAVLFTLGCGALAAFLIVYLALRVLQRAAWVASDKRGPQ